MAKRGWYEVKKTRSRWPVGLVKKKRRKDDMVHHPDHYGGADNVYEAIKVIEAWGLNFNLGSVLKYICRTGKKPGVDEIEDLKKSKWYLSREIARQEKVRGVRS